MSCRESLPFFCPLLCPSFEVPLPLKLNLQEMAVWKSKVSVLSEVESLQVSAAAVLRERPAPVPLAGVRPVVFSVFAQGSRVARSAKF
jgi:hypothetical protein